MRFDLILAVFVVAFALQTIPTQAFPVSAWTQIYADVEYATGYEPSNPRMMRAFAMKIDLQNPNVQLYASHDNGAASNEVTNQTNPAFLIEHGQKVAVNASFCSVTLPTSDVWGVVISNGTVVSGPYAYPCDSVLMFTQDNVPSLITTSTIPTGQWTAVAGGNMMLENGEFVTGYGPLSPVTGMGLSQDNRYLILLVIDGRQPGWSLGCDFRDEAQWMLDFGAWNAVQMDGGGSSSITRKDVGVWNHSCWNTSDPQDIRPVTVHLGIITTD